MNRPRELVGPAIVIPVVTELLRAGLSDRAIARELHVDAKTTVRRTRTALGIPAARPGKRAAGSVEDLFWFRVQPTHDGHLTWTGHRNRNRLPTVRHGGRNHSAYRIAFRIEHGREPEGHVTPACERDGCVAPACMQDRRIREHATVKQPPQAAGPIAATSKQVL